MFQPSVAPVMQAEPKASSRIRKNVVIDTSLKQTATTSTYIVFGNRHGFRSIRTIRADRYQPLTAFGFGLASVVVCATHQSFGAYSLVGGAVTTLATFTTGQSDIRSKSRADGADVRGVVQFRKRYGVRGQKARELGAPPDVPFECGGCGKMVQLT